jgi:CheY-like chemotaxis protein
MFEPSKSVLVVDDYEPVCELIQLLLVGVGYEVHISTSGRNAVQIARILPRIHLTICAVDLQDMPAEECVEECMQCHPDAAVLFLMNSETAIRTARPHAALDKPFTIKELRTAVCSAVGPAL